MIKSKTKTKTTITISGILIVIITIIISDWENFKNGLSGRPETEQIERK